MYFRMKFVNLMASPLGVEVVAGSGFILSLATDGLFDPPQLLKSSPSP